MSWCRHCAFFGDEAEPAVGFSPPSSSALGSGGSDPACPSRLCLVSSLTGIPCFVCARFAHLLPGSRNSSRCLDSDASIDFKECNNRDKTRANAENRAASLLLTLLPRFECTCIECDDFLPARVYCRIVKWLQDTRVEGENGRPCW